MTDLDHAIENLEKLLGCFLKQEQMHDAGIALWELRGFTDVRDGVPRERREQELHHPDLLYRYRQARQDAERLSGTRDERESQP